MHDCDTTAACEHSKLVALVAMTATRNERPNLVSVYLDIVPSPTSPRQWIAIDIPAR